MVWDGVFSGKIVTHFQIDEYGSVSNIQTPDSLGTPTETMFTTISNIRFIENLKDMMKNWNFGRIYVKGAITDVIYPFVFEVP